MLEDEICTIEEVASALGRTPDYLRRNWRQLAARRNFPRPLPGSSYDRWSRHAFVAWLRSNGHAASQHEEADDIVSRTRAAIHAELGVGR